MAGVVLVIDDDENLAELVRLSLPALGLSVYKATSGEQGLALYDQLVPDLVTLDVWMPDIDGWEVCRRLRRTSTVPIMFLTVVGGEEEVVRGLSEGADDYITKPFTPAELRARVIALLRRAGPASASATVPWSQQTNLTRFSHIASQNQVLRLSHKPESNLEVVQLG